MTKIWYWTKAFGRWSHRLAVFQLNLLKREVHSSHLILRGQHFCCLISCRLCGHVHIIKLLRPHTSTRPPPLYPAITLLPSSPEIITVLQMKSQSHKSVLLHPRPTSQHHRRFSAFLPISLTLLSSLHLTWEIAGFARFSVAKKTHTQNQRKERGTDWGLGGLSNPGFPLCDFSSWPMVSIKLASVSHTSLCVCVCV